MYRNFRSPIGFGRPAFFLGAPLVGGLLGGLVGSTLLNPYFYGRPPFYGYPPYGPYGPYGYPYWY